MGQGPAKDLYKMVHDDADYLLKGTLADMTHRLGSTARLRHAPSWFRTWWRISAMV
jgi:hypothetical protein